MLGFEGVLHAALMGLCIVDAPIKALLHSQTAVTLVLAHSWAAFAILPLYLSLEKIGKSLLEAAADLGENPWRTFWRVTFPAIRPAILTSLLMTFTISFDESFMAFFLSSTEVTLPMYVWGSYAFPRISRPCRRWPRSS